MPRRLFLAIRLVAAAWLLVGCGSSEASVRKTVEAVAQVVDEGLNQRDLGRIQTYLATEAEGANVAGLADTWGIRINVR